MKARAKNSKDYTIIDVNDLVVPERMKKKAHQIGSSTDKNGSSTETRTESSPETNGSSAEEDGSTTDDITHYKSFERTIHKDHSLTAARSVRGACVNPAGADDAFVHKHIPDK